MICEKCNKDNPAENAFCSACGQPLGTQPTPVTTPIGVTAPPQPKKKSNKKLIFIIGGICIVILLFMLFSSPDEEVAPNNDTTEITSTDDAVVTNDSQTNTDAPDATNDEPTAGLSIETITTLINQSTSGTSELTYNSENKVPLSPDALAMIQSSVQTYSLTPIAYPFYYFPEFKVILDSGLTYTIMQDTTSELMAVLQIEGESQLYKVDYTFFKGSNNVPTTYADDMTYMHIFNDGTSAEDAISKMVNEYLFAHLTTAYLENLGILISPVENAIKVTSHEVLDLTDIHPKLRCVIINVSVDLLDATGTENLTVGYLDNNQIKDIQLCGGVWVEEVNGVYRAYPIGLAVTALDVNENSPFDIAAQYYNTSMASQLK